jgi:hypothetical protein
MLVFGVVFPGTFHFSLLLYIISKYRAGMRRLPLRCFLKIAWLIFYLLKESENEDKMVEIAGNSTLW